MYAAPENLPHPQERQSVVPEGLPLPEFVRQASRPPSRFVVPMARFFGTQIAADLTAKSVVGRSARGSAGRSGEKTAACLIRSFVEEVAPKSYSGRVMSYSKGFLSQSMKLLWRDQVREWNARRVASFDAAALQAELVADPRDGLKHGGNDGTGGD